MSRVVRMYATGGPEVFTEEDVQLARPGEGELLVRQQAIGVNYQDVYLRTGDMPPAGFPFVNGFEAAGVVETVGPGVTGFAPGDRVAYRHVVGAYAEARVIAADQLVHLPPDVSFTDAAGLMLKGLTAQMLVHHAYRVRPGDVVLVHAAAGGVGSLLCRWARHRGGTVVGVVGSAAKLELARRNADHVVRADDPALQQRIDELTDGRGADVVYDGVGKSTFATSMASVRRFGTVVLYGWASGRPEPIDPRLLLDRSSYVIAPSGTNYFTNQRILEESARALFDALRDGTLGSPAITTYPLSDVGQAHRALESRATTGSIVLLTE